MSDREIKIETRLKQVEDQIFLAKELPKRIGVAVADALGNTVLTMTEAVWWQVLSIDLTDARNRVLYGTYREKPDCMVYLPSSTGVGTVYLNDSNSFGFAMGTTYKKIRGNFTELYINNTAQAGLWMYLIIGKGNLDVTSYTMDPLDLQAQYRPVAATTTTLLNAAQVYRSDWYDAQYYAYVTLLSASDQVSAVNGVEIQQSADGVNPDFTDLYSTAVVVGDGINVNAVSEELPLTARYVRIVYTNGAVNQGSFRLTARVRVI